MADGEVIDVFAKPVTRRLPRDDTRVLRDGPDGQVPPPQETPVGARLHDVEAMPRLREHADIRLVPVEG